MAVMFTRVHGNAAVMESNVSPRGWWPFYWGWGMEVQANSHIFQFPPGPNDKLWIHIAIPVAWPQEWQHVHLDNFFVFFDTLIQPGVEGAENNFGVDIVDVWDGSARLNHLTFPRMSGDWKNPRGHPGVDANTWVPRQPDGKKWQVNTGLGLSMHVRMTGYGQITVHSAGATWTDG